MRFSFTYRIIALFAFVSPLAVFAQEPAMSVRTSLSVESVFMRTELMPESIVSDSVLLDKRFRIQPIANLAMGYGSRPLSVSWLGGQMHWTPNKRWSFQAGYALAGGLLPTYMESIANRDGYIPGLGYAVQDRVNHLYHTHYTFGRAKYKAGKHFVFELGKSKHFWGDGYRSMILSDNASPVPYFKIVTTLGKFRNVNQWMRMRDISAGQTLNQSRIKYGAMHSLSYQITPTLQASLYEWVVWQNSDTLSTRGLDLYYLNPLIFYRPVEYSLGSPDNVMLAASLRWNATPTLQLYGQFVLDEFNLRLFKRGNNWWGNKIAGQFGLRWNTPLQGLAVGAEMNIARPFIYSHGSSIQAWTHINQSMAHPLGANFVESCLRLSYAKKLWNVTEQLNAAAFGRDYDANGDGIVDNFGGNITRSYANPYGGSFGHDMLQGELHRTIFHGLTVSRAIAPTSRWEVYLRHNLRLENVNTQTIAENWIMVGIQTRGMLQPVQDY
jgi:hypothetical protein